jgi:glycerol-3-phosphate O-acyltransferase/dihydroxyacetone phosphate acyltransferase
MALEPFMWMNPIGFPLKESIVINSETATFSLLKPKFTLILPKGAGEAMISAIVSDTEVLLAKPFEGDAASALLDQVDENGMRIGTSYKFTPHVDQSKMFSEVVNRLAKNQAVGIFPEGGSHDRSINLI